MRYSKEGLFEIGKDILLEDGTSANMVYGCEKTFVLDTPTNRERLPVRAKFVDEQKFRRIFSTKAEGYIVYHKALSVRDEKFDPTSYLKGRW